MAYVVVVLYSLLEGGVDFALPLKTAFLTAVAIPLYFTFNSLRDGWRVRRNSTDRLYEVMLTFVVDVIGTSLLIYYAMPTLSRTFSSVNLTGVDASVKVFASFAVVLMLVFLGITIYQTATLKRIGEVPTIPIPAGREES